ncbi:hypothetical protein [Winogradskyella immobilis]|uniref:Uncharacterized protein n=1 Tax=Winogradskyella immobilis TaxID=2816852 RepID=A0ABS8EIM8_9FLAO|nr:hypothetical protein [Winogradskyella immobilis]MCC1483063.1 hypothetical protein [Winogradskyella immobilis]MCG0015158.1 hypothetical protein [Winogradskyella immobilis]
MKNVLFLVFLSFLIFSCGSDDDNNDDLPVIVQFVSVNVDGVSRVFDDNVTIDLVENALNYRLEDNNSDDWISFRIAENLVGTDFIGDFILNMDGINFIPSPMSPLGEFTSTISLNNSTGLTGVFSGGLANEFDASMPQLPEVALTNGIIQIER